MKAKTWIKKSQYAHTWVDEDYLDSALYRWERKKVYKKQKLWDEKDLKDVKLEGVGKLSYDEESYAIKFTENTDVEDEEKRPTCSLVLDLHQLDATAYNRVSLFVKVDSTGFSNFYFHFSFGNQENLVVHTQSIIPNEWNQVLFEVEDYPRDHVSSLVITPFLFGMPPEATPMIDIYVRSIYVEQVDPDDTFGWETQDRIAYAHSGYFLDARKEAITQQVSAKHFVLKNNKKEVVYQGVVKNYQNSDGAFQIMNFSDFREKGTYFLEVENRKTGLFEINENPYLGSIWKSIQFLRTLRCGEEVEKVHSACHLNCRCVHPDGRSVPVFGGWHDAGDVSQFEICTAEMAEAILDLASTVKETDSMLASRLLEEAKIGITWLLRTSFEDGNRALAVGYRMWRKNILQKNNQDVFKNQAENGPFENLLSASALLKAYLTFQKIDAIYANWCLRIAKIDYEEGIKGYEKGLYTIRWGKSIDVMVAGVAAQVVSKLYTITKDVKYVEEARHFGKLILACQAQELPNWEKPLVGFFYEDVKHEHILTFEHRGHEQTPIQGLASLCETFTNHPDYFLWMKGIRLYGEYIKQTIQYTHPYQFVPAQIYQIDHFNLERFTVPKDIKDIQVVLEDFKQQAMQGIKLDEKIYLRKFPIALQRRGFHATLLSKAKAISLCARVLNDQELKQIAIDQIEWVMGKNPFSTSSMYGEGYNYHPLYVAYSPQLVGALPVGFKTKGIEDKPYWPTVNQAVYKEIWGHTTGKYLSIMADILKK